MNKPKTPEQKRKRAVVNLWRCSTRKAWNRVRYWFNQAKRWGGVIYPDDWPKDVREQAIDYDKRILASIESLETRP